jgi:hypothetical protein
MTVRIGYTVGRKSGSLLFLFVAAVAAWACGGGPYRLADETVRMDRRPVSLDSVTLAVAATPRDEAACGERMEAPGHEVWTVDWREDGRLVRRISVRFEHDGSAAAYTDMRGELVRVLDARNDGPGTSVHIQMDNPRMAYVQNVVDGRTTTRQVGVDAALASQALDHPAGWIEWVRDCR